MKDLFIGNISPAKVKLAGKTQKEGTASLLGISSSKEKFANFISKKLNKGNKDKKELSTFPSEAIVVLSTNTKIVQKGKKGISPSLGKNVESVKNKMFNGKTIEQTANSKTNFLEKPFGKHIDKLPIMTGLTSEKSIQKAETKGKIVKPLFISGKEVKTQISTSILLKKTEKHFKNIVDSTQHPNIKEASKTKKSNASLTKTKNKDLVKKTIPNNEKTKNKGVTEKTTTIFNEDKNNSETMKTKLNEANINKTSNITSTKTGENFKSNNDVKVKIITLKKGKVNLEEQVSKVVEKLNLKHNQQRTVSELKGNFIEPSKQEAVIERVMAALKAAQKQKPTHRAILELEPKSLGKIEVKISINQNQKVEIQVKTENPAVKSMIESSFASLSSFVGNNHQDNNNNRKQEETKGQFLFEDFNIPAENQVQIIEELLSNDGAINIIV